MTTSVQSFAPYRGESFATTTTAGIIDLTLHSVEPHAVEPHAGGSESSFTLVFHGPSSPSLKQGTFEMHHTTLGALAIFLVPIAATAERTEYEAVFNAA